MDRQVFLLIRLRQPSTCSHLVMWESLSDRGSDRLIPLLQTSCLSWTAATLYVTSFPFGRTSLNLLPASSQLNAFKGNARLEGLTTDLHVSGSNYNVALMLFFLGYVLFEVSFTKIRIFFINGVEKIGLTHAMITGTFSMGTEASQPSNLATLPYRLVRHRQHMPRSCAQPDRIVSGPLLPGCGGMRLVSGGQPGVLNESMDHLTKCD